VQRRLRRVAVGAQRERHFGERHAADVVQQENRALPGRQVLECDGDREPHVLAPDQRDVRSVRRVRQRVERDRVDELGHATDALFAPQMVEADGRGDAEQPALDGRGVVEIARPSDRARDRFLAQVVGIRAAPGHAIAVRPRGVCRSARRPNGRSRLGSGHGSPH
jgi:hypothetical protein